jgi:hypothetical protein
MRLLPLYAPDDLLLSRILHCTYLSREKLDKRKHLPHQLETWEELLVPHCSSIYSPSSGIDILKSVICRVVL